MNEIRVKAQFLYENPKPGCERLHSKVRQYTLFHLVGKCTTEHGEKHHCGDDILACKETCSIWGYSEVNFNVEAFPSPTLSKGAILSFDV